MWICLCLSWQGYPVFQAWIIIQFSYNFVFLRLSKPSKKGIDYRPQWTAQLLSISWCWTAGRRNVVTGLNLDRLSTCWTNSSATPTAWRGQALRVPGQLCLLNGDGWGEKLVPTGSCNSPKRLCRNWSLLHSFGLTIQVSSLPLIFFNAAEDCFHWFYWRSIGSPWEEMALAGLWK